MRYACLAMTGVLAFLAACAATDRPDASRGRTLFSEYCAICHGEAGRGDGPVAGSLPVAPADLTRIAARNNGEFAWNAVMAKVHGYKGRMEVMPEFGTVLSGPTVIWRDETGTAVETPAGLLAIARYLASIQV